MSGQTILHDLQQLIECQLRWALKSLIYLLLDGSDSHPSLSSALDCSFCRTGAKLDLSICRVCSE